MSWQRCPICGGKGMVAAGFYNPSPFGTSSTSATAESCPACNGKGILLDPVAPMGGGVSWGQTPPWRVTSGGGFTSQPGGTFDPARYRNSTTAVRA